MSDLISRQAAINAADRADYTGLAVEDVKKVTDEVVKELKQLPSAQPEFPVTWWKTDHGYMWLCPHCGLPVHSDFEECLRCGIKRPSAQPEQMKGKWIRKSPTAWSWTCSCCKKDNAYAYSAGKYYEPDVLQDLFCPNCGADMREEEKHD